DLANPHGLHRGEVADLDRGIGAKVVDPDRVGRRATHRAHEDVVGAVLDPHQWSLANRARLVASVLDDEDRQPGVAQRGAFLPAAALVELDLVAYPLPGTGDVLG